jgi:hypothetical protein
MNGKRFSSDHAHRLLTVGILSILLISLGAGWAVAKSGGILGGKPAARGSKTARASLQRIGLAYRLPARKERPRRHPSESESTPPPSETEATPTPPVSQNILAKAVWTVPSNALVGVPVTLDGSSSQGNAPLECTWSFEDESGNTVWETHPGCELPFVFQVAGTKYVKLTVRDADGEVNSNRQSFAVGSSEPPPDTTPPDTAITAQPPLTTTESAASLSFSSSEPGSTFACKLDSGSWGSCGSPKSYPGLTVGSHTFSVRATDGAGNTDATPASATWTVEAAPDTTPPETTITAQPPATTTESAASLSFSSSESGSTFACKLDSGSWGGCGSPKSYSGLAVGAHTFSVRATDGAGNTDATPASATWTVETVASPGTHCFSSPHTCGYPDTTNTGASGALSPSGSITVSTNGAVVKDKEVSGKITINASNVTIENVKIVSTATGSGTQAISNNGSGNVIRNVTAGGPGSGSSTIEAALRGFDGVTLERDYFYNCNECVQGSATVKDSYLVVSSIYSGAHAEDIYVCSEAVTVEHSTLINYVNQTATVFGDTICGGGNKYTVKNSLLAGSGYVFYPQANGTNPTGAQTTITNNRIARCTGTPETKENGHWYCKGGSDSNGIYPYGGSYGIGAYFSGPTTWSGNVWDDNGAVIPEP